MHSNGPFDYQDVFDKLDSGRRTAAAMLDSITRTRDDLAAHDPIYFAPIINRLDAAITKAEGRKKKESNQ